MNSQKTRTLFFSSKKTDFSLVTIPTQSKSEKRRVAKAVALINYLYNNTRPALCTTSTFVEKKSFPGRFFLRLFSCTMRFYLSLCNRQRHRTTKPTSTDRHTRRNKKELRKKTEQLEASMLLIVFRSVLSSLLRATKKKRENFKLNCGSVVSLFFLYL